MEIEDRKGAACLKLQLDPYEISIAFDMLGTEEGESYDVEMRIYRGDDNVTQKFFDEAILLVKVKAGREESLNESIN